MNNANLKVNETETLVGMRRFIKDQIEAFWQAGRVADAVRWTEQHLQPVSDELWSRGVW